MCTVLVTGGAGFIGSHVSRALLLLGHKVIVLDDLSGGFKDNIDVRCMFVKGDICDQKLVEKLFKKYNFEYVFHLAAYAAEGLSPFIKRFNYTNNLIGSVNLLNEAIKHEVKCLVFTSSIAVYGDNQTPMRENMVPRPLDSYGIAKYAFEMELKTSLAQFGLNHIIFRLHNVYGEFQNIGDKYRNVAGIFMNQLMQKKPMTIFGDGSQTRAFSYIGDVAPVIARSILEPSAYNQIFNIGGDNVYTVKHLAEVVARAFGRKPDISYLEARHEVKHAFCSHDKVRKFFKNDSSTSLDEGIKKMSRWAKKAGPRKSRVFKDIEILKNMMLV